MALDARANSVDALAGLAYCHLEFKEYARAHGKFRAALVLSPRNEIALIGAAETYRYQNQDDRAITAYQRYLQLHPKGDRAEMARRQIKRLGGVAEPKRGDSTPAPDKEQPAGPPDAAQGDPGEPFSGNPEGADSP